MQNLEPQTSELKFKSFEKNFDEKFSGTKLDSPVFDKVLSILELDDTLMVTKPDCSARNTVEAQHVIRQRFDRKISVYIWNMGVIKE